MPISAIVRIGRGSIGGVGAVVLGRRGSAARPYPFAGREERRPVGGGPLAVDKIGVGGARDVEDVGRTHAHFAPLEAIGDRRGEALFLGILKESAERALPVIVVVALKFEIADD